MRVRDLRDGVHVAQPLVVRTPPRPVDGAGGADGFEVGLGDRTGSVTALVTADRQAAELCSPGAVVHVTGRFASGESGGRLHASGVRAATPEEYDADALLDGPERPLARMEADLRELIATIQNPHLRRLLATAFGEESEDWSRLRDAPAAKHYHQAYRHGLLEHSLTVAQAVSAISAIFPGIDRDLAVTGALLHDIGKLEAYETIGGQISMSDRGRLEGEIPLGYYRVRQAIERLDGFPADLGQAVTHIILSHHGTLAHGSPVVPCTREATLVHMIDNLGGRLGSFDRVEKTLPAGERWSQFDKGIGTGAYFPSREEPRREAA